MKTLKESYSLWKKKAENPTFFCYQRFVIPPNESVSKIRVLYNIQRGQMLFRMILRRENSMTSVPSSSKRGWTRLKTLTTPEKPPDPQDKYFVRNGEENSPYENELRNDSIIEQMKNLKKVIEFAECSDGSFILLEIYADFVQSFLGDWFFLNVANYKTEFVVNKKASTSLPRMKRMIRYKRDAQKATTAFESVANMSMCNLNLSSQDLLRNEVLKDLSSPKRAHLRTSEEIYRKAYHLRIE